MPENEVHRSPITNYVCKVCGARWDNTGRGSPCPHEDWRTARSTRVQVAFGDGAIRVIGPHNSVSKKWTVDMRYSSLALYWVGDRERMQRELQGLRAALDFIGEQVMGQ